jgi:RHS repeat-associated protein
VAESVYSYDETVGCGGAGGRGRLTSVTDLTGEECISYDKRGRLTRTEKTLFSKVATTQFQYDAADRVQSITYPDSGTAVHAFKQDGQLHSIAGVVSSVQYDLFGRPELVVRAKGTQDRFEYWNSTENFRLRRIEATKPAAGAVYLNLQYAYGPLGKVSSVTDLQHGSNPVLSDGATYGYDGLGRLTNVDWTSSSIPDESFQYNALGNIAQKGGSAFSYDPAKPHQATAWGPHSQITYDANGRRKQKGANQQPDREKYTYDALDRVKQVEVYAGGVLQDTAVHDYDYTGQRVSKTVDGANRRRTFNRYFESQGGFKTKYYYAGDVLIASHRNPDQGVFSEIPPGTSIPHERWILPAPVVWGFAGALLLLLAGPGRRPIRFGVAVPAARVLATLVVFVASASPLGLVLGCGADPVWRDYHGDHLGSTQVVTNYRGDLLHHVRYEAYGEIRGRFNASGGIAQPGDMLRWEFTGYESELESELQYAGARYYDPELAQFLTHDPARQFASPYAYGPWDPMNGTDPNGAVFGIDDLIVWAIVIALAAALDTYLESGDFGAALTSFGISFAGSLVAIGTGFVVGKTISAIASTSLQNGFNAAMKGVGTAYGAYGVGQSIREGRYFSAAASGASMVHAAYAAKSKNGTSPTKTASGAAAAEAGAIQPGDKIEGLYQYRQEIDLFGEDGKSFGHYWTEASPEGEGWGWYPAPGESLDNPKSILFGVEGSLNYGEAVDPHFGGGNLPGVEKYEVFATRAFGSRAEVIQAIRDFSTGFSGGWSWPIGPNCHTFQRDLYQSVGLRAVKAN